MKESSSASSLFLPIKATDTMFAQRRLAAHLLAACMVAGLWLLTQPYVGLRHDAILYLAQALKVSRPTQFEPDLFFASGSQDSLSIYSLIFGGIFKYLDVWPTQPIIIVSAHAAFLAALWRLLPARLTPRERWLGMAALALLRPAYGGLSIFCFAEPFLTARTLAEPLALWALVAGINSQHARAWLLVLVAAALHPLMALPAALTLWLLAIAHDRRWLSLLLLALPLAGLVWCKVAPFDALLKTYPDWWWRDINDVNEQVLVGQWVASDWASIATDMLVLAGAQWLLYRPKASPRAKALLGALLAACLGLVALAVLGTEILHNELLTQLQLWRGLWLVRALAVALTPAVLIALWRDGPLGPATAASVAVVLGLANLHWPTTWPSLGWPLLHLCLWRRKQPVSATFLRLSLLTSAIALLAVGGADLFDILALPADNANSLNYSVLGMALVTMALPILALLAWAMDASGRGPTAGRHCPELTALAALCLLMAGAFEWDRRTPFMHFLESHLHSRHPFEALIPEQAQVYWDESLAATWFVAKRPSYFARAQGAGLLFNEGTAIEFARRRKIFQPLMDRRGTCQTLNIILGKLPADSADCDSLDEKEVTKICTAAPDLAYIVSSTRFSTPAIATWRVPNDPGAHATLNLYGCASFR